MWVTNVTENFDCHINQLSDDGNTFS